MDFVTPLFVLSIPLLLLATCVLSITCLSFFVPSLASCTHPKNQWIDGLRGIAAALVAINHVPWAMELLAYGKDGVMTHYFQRIMQLCIAVSSFGVQIFFCITGMLFVHKIISTKTLDWPDFYKKRILRIVPAYVLLCVLACCVAAVYCWPIQEPLKKFIADLPAIFSFGLLAPYPSMDNFNFYSVIGINWTLGIEWRFYLLLPMMALFYQTKPKVFIPALLVFAFGDLVLTHNSCWVYFISGALSAPLLSKQVTLQQRRFALISIAACLALYAIFWNQWHIYGMSRWLVMSVLFTAVTVARPAILTYRPITHLGLISYSFYLLHCTVLFAFFHVPARYGHSMSDNVQTFVITACLALATAVVLSLVSYLFVERRFMFAKTRGAAAQGDVVLNATS